MKNNFEIISYEKSHTNADKLHSILPTVLSMCEYKDKKVLDVGCGDGFFTVPIGNKGAEIVYGLDNSKTQLDKSISHPNVVYMFGDMFIHPLPKVDIVTAPFVLNYSKNSSELESLLHKFSRTGCSKLIGVIDYPKYSVRELAHKKDFIEAKKYLGVLKKLKRHEDGEQISLEFHKNMNHQFTLYSHFFKMETIETILEKLGFETQWVNPILDNEFPLEIRDIYAEHCELKYFLASR